MGIDVYMNTDVLDEKDRPEGGRTWFEVSGNAGRAGYLREAYHGGPYATRYLVGEAFGDVDFDPRAAIGEVVNTLRDAGFDIDSPIVEGGDGYGSTPGFDERVVKCDDGWYAYPSAVLRERLPLALKIAEFRAKRIYGDDSTEALEALEGFVGLAEFIEEAGCGPPLVNVWA